MNNLIKSTIRYLILIIFMKLTNSSISFKKPKVELVLDTAYSPSSKAVQPFGNPKPLKNIRYLSPYKTSVYPKVYLSPDLKKKLHNLKQVQSILESPFRTHKKRRHTSGVCKIRKTPKLYQLVSSTPNYLTKITNEIDLSCPNQRSSSFEPIFDKLIQEKKLKTNHAQAEFDYFFKRPKSAYQTHTISKFETLNTIQAHCKK